MLKLTLVILRLLFFVLRSPLCFFFFPDTLTSAGDWDGSNSLTMNTYAVIVITSVLISFLKTKYWITDYCQVVTLLLCVADILDRSLGIYELGMFDLIYTVPVCFLLPSLYYISKYVRTSREGITQ